MKSQPSWHIIINARRCKPKTWRAWQKRLDKNQISFHSHFSNSVSEASDILAEQIALGHRHFIFAGGDGTVHHGGNLLIHHAGEKSKEIVFGIIACGTGNDWVRTFGLPGKDLMNSLRLGKSIPMNVLRLQWPNGNIRYAMNMLGGALDAAVVDSLNTKDYPLVGFLKYPFALIRTLMKPHSWKATILVDDKEYTHDWLTFEAGFGKYCGGGMYILPHAGEQKPALLLMKSKSLPRIIASLPKIYNGKIAEQPEAIAMHFEKMIIEESPWPMPIEADGEWLGYGPVTVTPVSGILNRLI